MARSHTCEVLESAGYLASHPGPASYQLCDFGQVLSEPWVSHLQDGDNIGPYPLGLWRDACEGQGIQDVSLVAHSRCL